jgi:hypothetical protein
MSRKRPLSEYIDQKAMLDAIRWTATSEIDVDQFSVPSAVPSINDDVPLTTSKFKCGKISLERFKLNCLLEYFH